MRTSLWSVHNFLAAGEFAWYNRSIMSFSVEHPTFSGPLGLLLELLDAEKLEIKDVSLAHIADQYLAYLDTNEVPHDALADFLLIAARLIYLKSRALMPYLHIKEEDEQAASLEDQLRAYRLFMEAATRLEALYGSDAKMFVRPVPTRSIPLPRGNEGVKMPSNVTVGILRESFGWILKRLEPFFALQQTSMERIKSVEERLTELTDAIKTRASMGFRDVIAGAKNKAEVVVSFLALLELVRRQIVRASQSHSQDILIERVT